MSKAVVACMKSKKRVGLLAETALRQNSSTYTQYTKTQLMGYNAAITKVSGEKGSAQHHCSLADERKGKNSGSCEYDADSIWNTTLQIDMY